jgi:hypothetical protein
MKYVMILKKGMVIDGQLTDTVGPFDGIREAFSYWFHLSKGHGSPLDVTVMSMAEPRWPNVKGTEND